MYALVVKQLTERDETWDAEGQLFSNGLPPDASTLNVWRALDDDRIPYYIIIADSDGIEAAFEWAARDAGVTIIQSANFTNSSSNENMTVRWKDELS